MKEYYRIIDKTCLECLKSFKADIRDHKRGNGNYCSISCGAKHSNKFKILIDLICRHCGQNYQSKNTSSKYCSTLCKSRSNYEKRKNILSPFKIKKLLNITGCEICGWNLSSVDIHHILPISKGGDNNLNNVILLCPNHHRMADRNLISQDDLTKIIKFRTISSSLSSHDKEQDAKSGN